MVKLTVKRLAAGAWEFGRAGRTFRARARSHRQPQVWDLFEVVDGQERLIESGFPLLESLRGFLRAMPVPEEISQD